MLEAERHGRQVRSIYVHEMVPTLNRALDWPERWRPGEAAHIINLSLLPVSDAELDALYNWLGHRAVSILSRGYGNCRITSTRPRNAVLQ